MATRRPGAASGEAGRAAGLAGDSGCSAVPWAEMRRRWLRTAAARMMMKGTRMLVFTHSLTVVICTPCRGTESSPAAGGRAAGARASVSGRQRL
jgi:hypothetical protein